MTAVPEVNTDNPPVMEAKKPTTFNIYPLLGIALVIAVAAIAYGGLLLFLPDEWALFQPAG